MSREIRKGTVVFTGIYRLAEEPRIAPIHRSAPQTILANPQLLLIVHFIYNKATQQTILDCREEDTTTMTR